MKNGLNFRLSRPGLLFYTLGIIFLLLGSAGDFLLAQETEPIPEDYEEDFGAPMLLVFALIALVIVLILVGVGIVIGLVILGGVAAMLGIGILTTSTLTGLVTRKPTTAAKALVLQVAAIGGLVAGAGTAVALDYFFLKKIETTTTMLAILGGIGGLVGGLILGFLFNFAWHRVLNLYLSKSRQK